MDRIKESFDSLPIAVCFFDKNGVVRLINHRMLAIASQLRKGGIQTLAELHDALRSPPPTVRCLDPQLYIFRFSDGTELRFAEESMLAVHVEIAHALAGHRRGCHGAYVAAEASAGGKRKAGGGK